jgi:predicted ester cyclase
MNFWKGMLFLGGYLSTVTVEAEAEAELLTSAPPHVAAPKAVVTEFLHEVRAGRRPERAGDFLAETVIAHQLNAERPIDVERSPADYARHIEDFKRAYGAFDLEVTELIAEGDRVYARWRQTGCHIGPIEGCAPTRRPVVELASAVYRVVDGKIVEYWIQVDRWGTEAQLRANRSAAQSPAACA